jgi:hypothetical protein
VKGASTPGPDGPPALRASIYPKDAISQGLAQHLSKLEEIVQDIWETPLWLILQDADEIGAYADVDDDVADAFLYACVQGHIEKGRPIALLIDSDGGSGRGAYRIASILRQHCGGFRALVPRRAKSAATLLALGADELCLGDHAELGPIDAQVWDEDKGKYLSALEIIETISHVHSFAAEAFAAMHRRLSTTKLVLPGTEKQSVLGHTFTFANRTVEPLMGAFDLANYSKRARQLKAGQKYTEALLRKKYSQEAALDIATILVNNYPEHAFIIDRAETERIIKKVEDRLNPGVPLQPLAVPPPPELEDVFNQLFLPLRGVFAIGEAMSADAKSDYDDWTAQIQEAHSQKLWVRENQL